MEETTPEEWRVIPGFPAYQVSSHGRVMSYRRTTPRLLSAAGWHERYRKPYLHVVLKSAAGEKKTKLVHQLVLLAFVGPRPAGMETLHINGDGSDNRLSNLRYGTSLENSADQRRHGRVRRRAA